MWRIFLSNTLIYTILLMIWLPEDVKSSPTNYHQIPVQQVSELETTNGYTLNEEGVHDQGDTQISNSKKIILTFKEQLWPYGIVYYTVDETMVNSPYQLGIVQEAMKIIMEKTCVQFQRIYPDKNGQYPVQSWVNIVGNNSGCNSDLGRNPIGGPSVLSLNVDTCFDVKGHALHELVHTLGIYHEHIRPDRDQHINIIWDNIKNGAEYNFQLLDANVVPYYGLPYDYDSIMHYSTTAFSKDRSLATIVPKTDGKKIGQRDHLSYYDVLKLLITYECSQTRYSRNKLRYTGGNNNQESENISSNPINNTTDRPKKATTTAISTTKENVSKHSILTTSFESLDKINNVNQPTTNYSQSEHHSKDEKYYSINPNFIFVSYPIYNFYYYE